MSARAHASTNPGTNSLRANVCVCVCLSGQDRVRGAEENLIWCSPHPSQNSSCTHKVENDIVVVKRWRKKSRLKGPREWPNCVSICRATDVRSYEGTKICECPPNSFVAVACQLQEAAFMPKYSPICTLRYIPYPESSLSDHWQEAGYPRDKLPFNRKYQTNNHSHLWTICSSDNMTSMFFWGECGKQAGGWGEKPTQASQDLNPEPRN